MMAFCLFCLDVNFDHSDFWFLPLELSLGRDFALDFPYDLGSVEDLGVIGRDVGYSALRYGDDEGLADAEVTGPQVDLSGGMSRPVLLLPPRSRPSQVEGAGEHTGLAFPEAHLLLDFMGQYLHHDSVHDFELGVLVR